MPRSRSRRRSKLGSRRRSKLGSRRRSKLGSRRRSKSRRRINLGSPGLQARFNCLMKGMIPHKQNGKIKCRAGSPKQHSDVYRKLIRHLKSHRSKSGRMLPDSYNEFLAQYDVFPK